jgi:hypothetical protein
MARHVTAEPMKVMPMTHLPAPSILTWPGDPAAYQLTLNWSNPESSSDSASCAVSYPNMQCTVTGVGGNHPTFVFTVAPSGS